MLDARKAGRIIGWVVAALLSLVALLVWRTGLFAIPHETGYFSPVFAPDGKSVFAIRRDVSAVVAGFGHEFFTPPARVHLRRDRFDVINIRLADGQITVVEAFPPSPLEGSGFQAYHGEIFGSAHAHLRWADPAHLEYEIAVTRYDTPLSRTYVTRKVWNPRTQAFVASSPWHQASTGMAGDEPQQLHDDLEAIAVPGQEAMPCAIAILRRGVPDARALVQTRTCREKYAAGLSAATIEPFSRRAEIEHAEKVRTTYAELVRRGREAGVPEGQAMLDAGEAMSRLGLYPKSTKLVAEPAECGAAGPRFDISDEQFRVGLFQDIARAIARPGEEVNKTPGAYVTHRDYTTSAEINAFIDAGHARFTLRAHGRCWRMSIVKP